MMDGSKRVYGEGPTNFATLGDGIFLRFSVSSPSSSHVVVRNGPMNVKKM